MADKKDNPENQLDESLKQRLSDIKKSHKSEATPERYNTYSISSVVKGYKELVEYDNREDIQREYIINRRALSGIIYISRTAAGFFIANEPYHFIDTKYDFHGLIIATLISFGVDAGRAIYDYSHKKFEKRISKYKPE